MTYTRDAFSYQFPENLFHPFTVNKPAIEFNALPETCEALNGGHAECTVMLHASYNIPHLLNIQFPGVDPPSHQLHTLPAKGGPETPGRSISTI